MFPKAALPGVGRKSTKKHWRGHNEGCVSVVNGYGESLCALNVALHEGCRLYLGSACVVVYDRVRSGYMAGCRRVPGLICVAAIPGVSCGTLSVVLVRCGACPMALHPNVGVVLSSWDVWPYGWPRCCQCVDEASVCESCVVVSVSLMSEHVVVVAR